MMDPDELVVRMAEVSLWTPDDWRRLLAAAASGLTVDGLLAGGRPPQERIRFVPAAIIAIDQAAQSMDAFSDGAVDQQLARAQAFATLAAVEQARIANLLTWKQLQVARQSAGIENAPLLADEITQQIEEGLGIA